MTNYVYEFVALLALAAGLAIIARAFKQPLIVAYIATGLIAGPFFLNLIHEQNTIRFLSDIGISLLLFIIGLGLTPRVIREIGKIAVIAGVGQVLFTSAIGYFLSIAFGFSPLTSLYVSIALSFSSTIIVLKLLSDRGDTEKLYGKISIGFLLVQDCIAILILFLIPLLGSHDSLNNIIMILFRGIIFSGLVFVIAYYGMKRCERFFSQSQELLFLTSLAWGLGIATLFHILGFSLEAGALMAGIALSNSFSRFEISARLRPLRDFFIVLFFVFLGSQMTVDNVTDVIIPALILSAFVLIGKPLILMIIMGLMGYRKKTGFFTGLMIAQISEFSFVLILLGTQMGTLTPFIVTLITLVALITIFGSTYMILYADMLYTFLTPVLTIFERKKLIEIQSLEGKNETYDIVLFGANRIGFDFLKTFKKFTTPFLVIDYNPDIVKHLTHENIHSVYGDASDVEFVTSLPLAHTQLAISTIPTLETNCILAQALITHNPKIIMICVAHTISDAFTLYEHGFHYVIMPHFLGGMSASELVHENKFDAESYRLIRTQHLAYLRERHAEGHEHPHTEKYT